MKTKMFSIFDSKGEMFGVPFFRPANGLALRDFTDLANNPETTVGRFPSDFVLYHVGTFDDADGRCEAVIPPVDLGHASNFVRVASRPPSLVPGGEAVNVALNGKEVL